MKVTALRFLVCPACRCPLDLGVVSRDGAEVMDGTLSCKSCRRDFPIRRGVPRFVHSDAYASSFGFQWNRFRDVQLDSRNGTRESESTLRATTGWAEQDYHGRLLLDAGVGAGRFAEIAARNGAEVVGIDVSRAVDAAFSNIGRNARVHVVQADIFSMPFRPGTFDLAYSIGVLHHTPDPHAAFRQVAAVVKPAGAFAVYLYHGYGPGYRCADLLRRVTTRLPPGLMFLLCAAAIPLHYLYRIPVLGKVLRFLAPISPHREMRWRWLDTFDWYTPKYQWKFHYPEVYRWFRAGGFREIEIFDDPIRMCGTKMETAT